MVEGSGLENRRYESIRGFESHSLRQKNAPLVGAFSFSAWIFAEWDSKGGSWRGAGGKPQPTWLFRRNACDLGRAIHDRPYAGQKETNYQPNRITI